MKEMSDFDIDLAFLAASLASCQDYKEEYWCKMEKKLNDFEKLTIPSSFFYTKSLLRTYLAFLIKVKYKLFRKLYKRY